MQSQPFKLKPAKEEIETWGAFLGIHHILKNRERSKIRSIYKNLIHLWPRIVDFLVYVDDDDDWNKWTIVFLWPVFYDIDDYQRGETKSLTKNQKRPEKMEGNWAGWTSTSTLFCKLLSSDTHFTKGCSWFLAYLDYDYNESKIPQFF